MKFQLRSAAKVNLTLDILSRRADGYHELASVVHTVAIWDEIALELSESGVISFTCNRSELEGDDNLCVRAIQKWREATGENFGARIHLEKRIPTGAGLGGGSGNAAAMLLALRAASKSAVSDAELATIGAKLGADVPLFLGGGAVLMEGIGEKLTPLAPIQAWALIVKPQISFPTPQIYGAWDGAELQSQNDTPRMLKTWKSGDLAQICAATGNDLERAAAKVSELPAQLIALLRGVGAWSAQMSGSGSACFGLFESEIEANRARRDLELKLAKLVPPSDASLFVAPFCAHGVEIAPL